jgi:LemA protein
MSSRAVSIIKKLYGSELRPKKRRGLLSRLLRRKRAPARDKRERMLELYRVRGKLLTRGRIVLLSCLGFLLLIFAISIYYYNKLTRYEQDVFKEKAKIDSLLQRRRNISINLARTVRDYAIHEQGIFEHVSDVRAASQGANGHKPAEESATESRDDGWLEELLPLLNGSGDIPVEARIKGLMAIAERYPDLKLSDNFRHFMQALVDTEKELSDGRMHYSDVVNRYTTQMKTFPGNMFARIYGFQKLPYYEADGEAKRFRPVEY